MGHLNIIIQRPLCLLLGFLMSPPDLLSSRWWFRLLSVMAPSFKTWLSRSHYTHRRQSSGKQKSVENHARETLWVKSGVNTPHFSPHYTDSEHSRISTPNKWRETEKYSRAACPGKMRKWVIFDQLSSLGFSPSLYLAFSYIFSFKTQHKHHHSSPNPRTVSGT